MVATAATEHPDISAELISEVNFDNTNFLTNEQLEQTLANTSATPTEVAAAMAQQLMEEVSATPTAIAEETSRIRSQLTAGPWQDIFRADP